MRTLLAAALGAIALLYAPFASAQCTTCSPLSLPSSTLVGPDLQAAREASWAIVTQGTTGWVGFPRQLADNAPFEARHGARYDLFLTTIQATALHRSGLGVDVVAPFGLLASRTGAERRSELSFGDAEVRGRGTTLLGRSVRLTAIAGAALPTGGYTPRSGAEALGESSRALTIGRGVFWALAEVEARWEPSRHLALTASAQGRAPLGEAADGFRWGPELRTLGEIEARPIAPIGLALGGELSLRGNGSIVDPFLNERVASENVGATIVSIVPSVRASLGGGVSASLSGRVPVHQDLVGLQFQQGPGVFLGVGYAFPIGGSARVPAAPSEKAATHEEAQKTRYVVREYGADWCDACKRLEPLFEASKRARADVRFERVDVTDWSEAELARRVPGATSLPIVEVSRADGTLLARLEGENAFSFAGHLDRADRTSPITRTHKEEAR
ncbi:MAG: thioredoxin family protein [Labilithrix sp.]|nr:thioredoxin family protein [Labilithrix sp.]